MVLHGEDPHWHEVNTEFVDPGITAYKEIGEGQEPRNLNEYVITNAYLLTINETKNPDGPIPIDPTRVNFFGPPEHGEISMWILKEIALAPPIPVGENKLSGIPSEIHWGMKE